MNIGIDIDDTINKLSETLIKYGLKYNIENNIKYDIKPSKWQFEEAFGWDETHTKKFMSTYIKKCFQEVEIKADAKEYINKLRDEGNKIIIITARRKENCSDIYDVSKNWLIEKGIKIDKLEIGCEKKSEQCKENKVDIFIDDNAENCRDVSKNVQIPVLLFDSIYNQEEKDLKRVYNWKEAYKEIKKLKK